MTTIFFKNGKSINISTSIGDYIGHFIINNPDRKFFVHSENAEFKMIINLDDISYIK